MSVQVISLLVGFVAACIGISSCNRPSDGEYSPSGPEGWYLLSHFDGHTLVGGSERAFQWAFALGNDRLWCVDDTGHRIVGIGLAGGDSRVLSFQDYPELSSQERGIACLAAGANGELYVCVGDRSLTSSAPCEITYKLLAYDSALRLTGTTTLSLRSLNAPCIYSIGLDAAGNIITLSADPINFGECQALSLLDPRGRGRWAADRCGDSAPTWGTLSVCRGIYLEQAASTSDADQGCQVDVLVFDATGRPRQTRRLAGTEFVGVDARGCMYVLDAAPGPRNLRKGLSQIAVYGETDQPLEVLRLPVELGPGDTWWLGCGDDGTLCLAEQTPTGVDIWMR
ncbi:MAG: hypothetical protein JXB46_07865 [Candidatus Eisenbacteria bacterium]|nr:hypothetical protein [Candidatus Eisenbacteria bacterium]